MGRDFRCLGDQGRIDIHGSGVLLTEQRVHLPQDRKTADPANRFIRIRKMMADITLTDRAEQCIGDCVAENVRIGMPFQSAIMWNLDPAQN